MRLRFHVLRRPVLQPHALRSHVLSILALLTAVAGHPAAAAERELFLAGGALKLCSSLSLGECAVDANVVGPLSRTAPRYSLEAASIDAALDPALWPARETAREAMRALLEDARALPAAKTIDADALREHFATRCVDARDGVRACRGGESSPWMRIDDDQQASVLAALEAPQFDGDVRRKERASLRHSRTPHGADILRAFVAAARERSGGESPKIAVVTASAFDPFDPVDFYLDALREAGAEIEWWPLDAALAAAVFERRDCTALPALRLQLLKLPARERIYPDLVAQQQRACEQPDALADLPQRVHGVFFSGGDQWKLRRAFFDREDRPNAWLQALRDAAAKGDVVVGGTSAGSAVQSGGPMLSNGTVEQALKQGAIASVPPVSGCMRSGDCVGGIHEDAFTYWPAGGLGLVPGIIVDTHFSERARELRLLRLLAATGTRVGIGVDETSALHLHWRDDGSVDGLVEIRAFGASGGWAFDATPRCDGNGLRANAYYIAPGAVLRMDALGLRWADDANSSSSDTSAATSAAASAAGDVLDGGALRSAAQSMAMSADTGLSFRQLLARAIDAKVVLTRTAATQSHRAADAVLASVGPLRIEIAPVPGCAPTR